MKPWSEMTPRERDALVAEKVMGQQVHWSAPDNYGHVYPKIKRQIGAIECPHYTTKISDAWEVVEKMRQEGHEFRLTEDAHSYKWVAWFNGKRDIAGISPTAPEASCIAALRAVGVEV